MSSGSWKLGLAMLITAGVSYALQTMTSSSRVNIMQAGGSAQIGCAPQKEMWIITRESGACRRVDVDLNTLTLASAPIACPKE